LPHVIYASSECRRIGEGGEEEEKEERKKKERKKR